MMFSKFFVGTSREVHVYFDADWQFFDLFAAPQSHEDKNPRSENVILHFLTAIRSATVFLVQRQHLHFAMHCLLQPGGYRGQTVLGSQTLWACALVERECNIHCE